MYRRNSPHDAHIESSQLPTEHVASPVYLMIDPSFVYTTRLTLTFDNPCHRSSQHTVSRIVPSSICQHTRPRSIPPSFPAARESAPPKAAVLPPYRCVARMNLNRSMSCSTTMGVRHDQADRTAEITQLRYPLKLSPTHRGRICFEFALLVPRHKGAGARQIQHGTDRAFS